MNRRILLIDDTPAIHEDYRKILGQVAADDVLDDLEEALFGETADETTIQFEYESAFQGMEGLAKVRESIEKNRPYAMAFVDMRMPPGWDGCETIRQIWREDPNIQIVICTAYSDSSWEQVLGTLDVQDRLLILKKPFDSIEVYQLASALTTKWEMTRQAAHKLAEMEKLVDARTREIQGKSVELEAANQRLSEAMIQLAALATTDSLTGLKNRRAFEDDLARGFATAVEEGTPLSVILFDIDHFKRFNDRYGHLAGDEALRQVGALLKRAVKGTETVARYGGEEFILVLPGHDAKAAFQIAEDLRHSIESEAFQPESVTASLGVASLSPGLTASDLVAEADRALYLSKEKGRNQVTLASKLALAA